MTDLKIKIPEKNRPVDIEPILIKPAQAARVLGISERTLWEMTKLKTVPHVRLGKRTLYPLEELRHWAKEKIIQPEVDSGDLEGENGTEGRQRKQGA